MRTGDLVTNVGEQSVRSLEGLAAALAGAHGRLPLALLRGTQRLTATVEI